MVDVHQLVNEQKSLIIDARRDLHRIPETAFTEEKTSAYVAERLNREGLDVRTGIAQYGVVGLLKTGRPGPTLLIRADMDALPITEETGLPFASTHEGRMHACGHDAHMAMVLGAARTLKKLENELVGNIKFLFQPAEEGVGGAKPMIEEGVMENPAVDYSIGCHMWPNKPEGLIGVKSGPVMASMDRFDIRIIGEGGHAAMPHLCVDPIDAGVQVVNALQRIVSRKMNPLEPTVLTVASFHAGTAFNIIPGEAELSGTTRTFNEEIWFSWGERMEKVVRGVCDSMGARFEFDYERKYPPTINDEFMTGVIRRCAKKVVGEDRVIVSEPTMGAEDMSYFLQKSKGCYYFIGVGREGSAPVHNSRFDFNEEVLPLGVETHCRVALDLLKR
ncbi:MAG: amidohydrolase [Desulfobacterales bacterium]|nr:amidohydrolase [Desulfobacterales bacterium]